MFGTERNLVIRTLLTLNILFTLTAIDKGHDQRNESSGRENDSDNVKARISKIETATDAEGADKETENESKERFPDIGSKEFFLQSDAMCGLFFSMSDEPLGETGDDRIILPQDLRRREKAYGSAAIIFFLHLIPH
jgi:hypothetical protein